MSDQPTPAGLDSECQELFRALNALPGIETVESCCGHGIEPYRFWFLADSTQRGLQLLSLLMDPRYYPFKAWDVYLDHRDIEPQTFFRLEGPVGAYPQARALAAAIQKLIDKET